MPTNRTPHEEAQTAQDAFDSIKEKLTAAPLLIHPNYAKPFIVQCDASQCGVGALLAQADENGDERPISYMSHKLNKAQRNYTVTELECLAVVLAIKKFRPYIEGQDFKVVTDHASLKWLMRQKDLSGRLARWALKLQGFSFTIEHRKGSENKVADALSRAYEGDEMDIAEIELEIMPEIDLESEFFESDDYRKLRENFRKAEMPDYKVVDKYICYRSCFKTEDNLGHDEWKLFVPKELREQVMYAAHNPPTSAHGGITKTLERIRRNLYWPAMVTDIRNYVLSCELCKTSKTPTYTLRPPMGKIVESERPFQRLYVDLIGPFPRSKRGNIGIFIVLDHFSKFTFLKPLRKFNASLIIEYLKQDIFDCFGVPETIVSDNGSQFTSKEFISFLNQLGVGHVRTAVYSPQSNAAERVNRSVNEALRSYIRKDQRNWDKYISSINCSLRNSLHQTIGKSPYYVIFGQNMLTHGKDYKVLRNLELLTEGSAQLAKEDEFSVIRETIKSKMQAAHDKTTRMYNLRSRMREFQPGQ